MPAMLDMPPPAVAGRPRSNGFALAVALFALVVVTGVLLDAALRARTERQQAMNIKASLQADAAARAGVNHALVRLRQLQRRSAATLGDASIAAQWNRPELLAMDLKDVPLQISRYSVGLTDVSSRLPLNTASEEELRRLLLALGAGGRVAEVAAQSIMDWRDEDGLHRPSGAEWDDYYSRQPGAHCPRNGPFRTLEELRHVRGMEELYERAAPYLRVEGRPQVNLNTAPAAVLSALPGMSDEAMRWLLNERAAARGVHSLLALQAALSDHGRAELQKALAQLSERVSFEPQLLEIVAVGQVQGSPLRRHRRAMAVRNGATVDIVRETAW